MAIRKINGDVDIVANSITSASITPLGITGGSLATGAIDGSKLASGSLDGAALIALSVPSAALATGAVGANQLAAGAVTNTKLGANAIDVTKMGPSSVGTSQLQTGAVTANELASNAVTSNKIASLAVISTKIATGAVGTSQMATGSVTRAVLAATAVGTAQMGLLSVDNTILATGAAVANIGYTPVNVAGDTMTGVLTLFTAPSGNMDAVTKIYVDRMPMESDFEVDLLFGSDTLASGINRMWGKKVDRIHTLGTGLTGSVGEVGVTGGSLSTMYFKIDGSTAAILTFATGATAMGIQMTGAYASTGAITLATGSKIWIEMYTGSVDTGIKYMNMAFPATHLPLV